MNKSSLTILLLVFIYLYVSPIYSQSLDIILKKYESHLNSSENKDSLNRVSVVYRPISLENWPLFCRWEEKWQKSSGIAIRFRLGDLQTVDKLEGK